MVSYVPGMKLIALHTLSLGILPTALLHMRKQHRECKYLAQGYARSKWCRWDLISGPRLQSRYFCSVFLCGQEAESYLRNEPWKWLKPSKTHYQFFRTNNVYISRDNILQTVFCSKWQWHASICLFLSSIWIPTLLISHQLALLPKGPQLWVNSRTLALDSFWVNTVFLTHPTCHPQYALARCLARFRGTTSECTVGWFFSLSPFSWFLWEKSPCFCPY